MNPLPAPKFWFIVAGLGVAMLGVSLVWLVLVSRNFHRLIGPEPTPVSAFSPLNTDGLHLIFGEKK